MMAEKTAVYWSTVALSSGAVLEAGNRICNTVTRVRTGFDRSMSCLPAAVRSASLASDGITYSSISSRWIQVAAADPCQAHDSGFEKGRSILACDWLPHLDHAVPHPFTSRAASIPRGACHSQVVSAFRLAAAALEPTDEAAPR